MRLLDSDVIIDILRGHRPALEWFISLPLEDFSVSGYVAMELIQGTRNRQQLNKLLRVVNLWPIYWPSPYACTVAMRDLESFHLSHRLGAFDSLIAQSAIELDAILCTFNLRHFRSIEGLVTEQPYAR